MAIGKNQSVNRTWAKHFYTTRQEFVTRLGSLTKIVNNLQTQALPTFIEGSVPFADPSGDLTEDNNNLFFDDATNRLGIAIPSGGGLPYSLTVSSNNGTRQWGTTGEDVFHTKTGSGLGTVPSYFFRKADGTVDAPIDITDGHQNGYTFYSFYSNGAYRNSSTTKATVISGAGTSTPVTEWQVGNGAGQTYFGVRNNGRIAAGDLVGNGVQLLIDPSATIVQWGDITATNNGIQFTLSDTARTAGMGEVNALVGKNRTRILLNDSLKTIDIESNGQIDIGDVTGVGNGNLITVDDTNDKITLVTNEIGLPNSGSYADDVAAGVGGVAVGGVYWNTTNNALHTKMT